MRWIYESPKAAQMLGQALFSVGGFMIVCGLIGRAAMIAINQGRSIGNMPPLDGLSDAYPGYPLWWVPEHFLGYALCAVLAAAGLYIGFTAKSVSKATRRFR